MTWLLFKMGLWNATSELEGQTLSSISCKTIVEVAEVMEAAEVAGVWVDCINPEIETILKV